MKRMKGVVIFILSGLCASMTPAMAGISIEPFASVSSTKEIKPDKAGSKNASGGSATETETIKQRTTYGLRGSVGFFRIMKFQLGVGTNELTTTSKTSQAVDDYGEINFEKDLDMDTSDPEKEVKITETQNKATATMALDPSFSIFMLRAKAGVVATQRKFSKESDGAVPVKYTSPIKYKPVCGAGAGIKLGPKMFFMAEYNLFLYKFPEKEPFEREVVVSYGVSI
jgi:hypothetical protein